MLVSLAASLVPGVNALLAGRRGLAGIVALGTVAAFGAAAGVIRLAGGLLHTIVSPATLVSLVALNLLVLGLRLEELRRLRHGRGSHILQQPARRLRRRDRVRVRRQRRVALAMTLPLIALPHLLITSEVESLRRTVVDTFETASATAATRASTATSPSSLPSNATGVVDDDRQSERSDEAATRPVGLSSTLPVTADGTVDVLLIGLDAGAGRVGARNDANLVVSIDPVSSKVTLIGIPRNLVRMPFPSSEDPCRCYQAPLYSLYRHGHEHAERWPDADDPGAEAVREAASALIGRSIGFYLVADLAGFRHVVDAVGGIDIEVSEPVRASWADPENLEARIGIDIDPGRHHLDGSQALAYARVRADSDDYRRMERQRCLLASAGTSAHGLSAPDALRLLATTRGEVASDIPRDALSGLVDLAQQVEVEDIASIGLVPPDFVSGWAGGHPIPDLEHIRSTLRPGSEPSPSMRTAVSGC